MMQWITDQPPPRDGQPFLADVGWPWAVVAVWNEPSKQYCYAQLDIDMFMGVYNDATFVNEWASPKGVVAWTLPALPTKPKPTE